MAHWQGLVALAIYWDLAKFYDSVSLVALIAACKATEFPLAILVLALQAHTGPRVLRMLGCCSEPMYFPGVSILAGCVSSTRPVTARF